MPPVLKSSFATSDDCNSFHRGRIILKVYIFEKPLRRAFQKHYIYYDPTSVEKVTVAHSRIVLLENRGEDPSKFAVL
jgi:hypothetical protein